MQGTKAGGIDFKVAREMAREIKSLHDLGCEVAIVIGAGNMFRGREARKEDMDRNTADYIGMIATIMNGMALEACLKLLGAETALLSALYVPKIAQNYSINEAVKALKEKKIVLLVGGTGNPYFTTDTAVILRALELVADVVLKATKVDGVYDKDPMRFPSAKKYDEISFQEAIEKNLKIMDQTAFSLCANNNLPVIISKFKRGALVKAVKGEKVGTLVRD